MARKRPWFTRLFTNLYDNIETTCLTPGQDGTNFLPRLGTCRFIRVVTLRTRTDDDRVILTHMTPEQAIDLGTALVKAGKAQGAICLEQGGEGYAVNTATTRDGWTTATASTVPNLLEDAA